MKNKLKYPIISFLQLTKHTTRSYLKECGFIQSNSILTECTLLNISRIYHASIIAMIVNLIHIFLFVFPLPNETVIQTGWRFGILFSHSVLLITMLGLFLLSRKLRKQNAPNRLMHVLQYAAMLILMVVGVMIVSIDQFVTSNITPFLLVCIISGTVFLIRPLHALLIYIGCFAIYYFTIALAAPPPEVLLSNRVNGVSSIGIGICLSVIMWRYNYINIMQKRHIQAQKKELEQLAHYDSLTGLSNRHFFDDLIKNEIASMIRLGHSSSIIILDIDHFKSINDTYGHPSGDSILKQLAVLIKNNLSENDSIARLGGEEFIILLPRMPVKEAKTVAERLRMAIEETEFIIENIQVHITASFGIAPLQDIHNNVFFNYYRNADEALYAAKENGRNRVEMAFA